MTPGARIAAAIEILDTVQGGVPAEKALTAWARRSRFAGSKDRAAVRTHVFDALRRLQTFAALGGGSGWPPTGRAVMIGAARAAGTDPGALFTGQGHAPAPLDPRETEGARHDARLWNLPDWLAARLRADLGEDTARAQAKALETRAPVTLRVNRAQSTPTRVQEQLESAGYAVRPNPLAPDALTVPDSPRGLASQAGYLAGDFEMQDASSQAAVAALPLSAGLTVLDFCAGGGGKALAIAARTRGPVLAHDAAPARMKDLPARAARAGAQVRRVAPDDVGDLRCDLVVVDAPCSGSGTWRRTPDEKWRLTPDKLDGLIQTQADILDQACTLVRPGGILAYMTCSIINAENDAQITAFQARHTQFSLTRSQHWPISDDGDGFFLSILRCET